jgi:hypothetical protein
MTFLTEDNISLLKQLKEQNPKLNKQQMEANRNALLIENPEPLQLDENGEGKFYVGTIVKHTHQTHKASLGLFHTMPFYLGVELFVEDSILFTTFVVCTFLLPSPSVFYLTYISPR